MVNMRFVKPLDEKMILSMATRHRALITIEENAIIGGAGAGVSELLAAAGLQLPTLHVGIPDRFIEHGTRETCLARAGLDLAGITAQVETWWTSQSQARIRSVSSA
jgi:1-deoxy-D-xylulose-5-phosphate synthase